MSDEWTTVNGSSGGRRNGKNKYQAQASRGLQPTMRIKGEPIRMEQKLAELAVENEWFEKALSEPLKQQLVQAVVALLEKHIGEMESTAFFRTIYTQLQEARARIQKQLNASSASSTSSSSSSSPTPATSVSPPTDRLFDIVIYGIGRYAEYAPPAHLRDELPTAATATPTVSSAASSSSSIHIDAFSASNVRSSIRTSSRPAQIQLALIVAVMRALQKEEASSQASTTDTSSVTSSLSPLLLSSFQVHLYDPMLSSLEKAVASAIGIHPIPENEEGCRPLGPKSLPTLFYMPHCPQTLYNNVLWSNWDLRLTKIFVLGNSFTKYYTNLNAAANVVASNVSASAAAGYYRAGNGRGKKKRSDFAQKLAQDPICCDHHDEESSAQHIPEPTTAAAPAPTADSAASTTTSSASSFSSPYPCLQAIGPILVEQEVLNTHESQTVFNDLNLHIFEPDQALLQLLIQKSNTKGTEASEIIPPKYLPFFTQFPRVSFGGAAASSDSAASGANDTEIIPATLTNNV